MNLQVPEEPRCLSACVLLQASGAPDGQQRAEQHGAPPGWLPPGMAPHPISQSQSPAARPPADGCEAAHQQAGEEAPDLAMMEAVVNSLPGSGGCKWLQPCAGAPRWQSSRPACPIARACRVRRLRCVHFGRKPSRTALDA